MYIAVSWSWIAKNGNKHVGGGLYCSLRSGLCLPMAMAMAMPMPMPMPMPMAMAMAMAMAMTMAMTMTIIMSDYIITSSKLIGRLVVVESFHRNVGRID